MNLRRTLAIWLVIIVVETIHGALRTTLLQPIVGDLRARQVGVIVGSALILAVAYLSGDWLRAESRPHRLAIGGVWVVLTLGFEIILGRVFLHQPWARLLSDYDVSRGGWMLAGMLVLALAPLLASWARARVARV